MPKPRHLVIAIVAAGTLVASCGGDSTATTDAATTATAQSVNGFGTISAGDAAALTNDPPAGLVVLDVRTADEFAEGHLDGAVQVDFYDADFADQLATLDRNVPYLVYCHSGNRSGQTLPIMQQLGFSSVVDISGGIVAWADAGLPVTTN